MLHFIALTHTFSSPAVASSNDPYANGGDPLADAYYGGGSWSDPYYGGGSWSDPYYGGGSDSYYGGSGGSWADPYYGCPPPTYWSESEQACAHDGAVETCPEGWHFDGEECVPGYRTQGLVVYPDGYLHLRAGSCEFEVKITQNNVARDLTHFADVDRHMVLQHQGNHTLEGEIHTSEASTSWAGGQAVGTSTAVSIDNSGISSDLLAQTWMMAQTHVDLGVDSAADQTCEFDATSRPEIWGTAHAGRSSLTMGLGDYRAAASVEVDASGMQGGLGDPPQFRDVAVADDGDAVELKLPVGALPIAGGIVDNLSLDDLATITVNPSQGTHAQLPETLGQERGRLSAAYSTLITLNTTVASTASATGYSEFANAAAGATHHLELSAECQSGCEAELELDGGFARVEITDPEGESTTYCFEARANAQTEDPEAILGVTSGLWRSTSCSR